MKPVPTKARYFFICLLILQFSPVNVSSDVNATRFWHVGMVVKNMDLMHRFYTEVLGLENVTDLAFSDAQSVPAIQGVTPLAGLDGLMGIKGSRTVIRHYSAPNYDQFLEFIHFPDHASDQVDRHVYKPMGWNHIGLQVGSIDSILTKMKSTRLGTVVGGPTILKEFNNNLFLMLKDPEGNIVELYEISKE